MVWSFETLQEDLDAGNFTKLKPCFEGGEDSVFARWFRAGKFEGHQTSLGEALACACFHDEAGIVGLLLDAGADPMEGQKTGMSPFHWAVNRGNLETVRLLIARGIGMEVKNNYGGTVLGCAVWSAVHEPKPDHLAIIHALVEAGAEIDEVERPIGDRDIGD